MTAPSSSSSHHPSAAPPHQSPAASSADHGPSAAGAGSSQFPRPSSSAASHIRRGLAPLATHNLNANIASSSAASADTANPASTGPGTGSGPGTGAASSSWRLAYSQQPPKSPALNASGSSSNAPHTFSLPTRVPSSSAPRSSAPGGGASHFAYSAKDAIGTGTGRGGVAAGGAAGNVASPQQGGVAGAGSPGGPNPAASALTSPTSGAVSFAERSSNMAGPVSAGAVPSSSSSSLSKISVAQVFLLLDSITEKEGKEKWDAKAAQIHKLVDSNGMDVFSKYFRRLLSGNAAQIFPTINRPVENAGNYPLLVEEVNKVALGATDLEQAQKIADTIDSSVAGETPTSSTATTSNTTGPSAVSSVTTPSAATGAATQTGQSAQLFRDFDLATFVDHFRLDPIAKVALVLAFRNVGRSDLRNKADVILASCMPQFLASLSTSTDSNKDFSPAFIAVVLERLILNPPRNYTLLDLRSDLIYSVTTRYITNTASTPAPSSALGAGPMSSTTIIPPGRSPVEIENALQMFGVSDQKLALVRQIQAKGPKAMQTQESIAELINSVGANNSGINGWNEEQVGTGLIYITMTANWRQYSPQLYLSTIQHLGPKEFDWSALPCAFDRPHLRIDTEQFVRLFNCLLAISRDASSAAKALDVQLLWGGEWKHRDAQLSFLAAFIASNIDVTSIPNLRTTFSMDPFTDAPSEAVKAQAVAAAKNPFRSLDAVKATFDLVLRSTQTWAMQDCQQFVSQLLQPNLSVFLVSISAIPQPWTPVQLNFILRTINVFLTKSEGYRFALYGAWLADRTLIIESLFRAFHQDPKCSELIYELAVEFGWLDSLLETMNGLSMDLACIAHSRSATFDLEKWIHEVSRSPAQMGELLSKFLKIKAEDELAFQRKETAVHRMTMLSVKTVFTILLVLEDILGDGKPLHDIQRTCVQTYPRLINYGDGYDDIIEANSANGNGLPDEVEKEMQDLFGKMYHEELSLRQVLEIMRRYKASRDPHEQDLFTCMVHGLIDEYNCYPEYPIEALTKAAVLFGGLINFRLVSGITLKVCLSLILDSVKDRNLDELMFKFGVEAIEQIVGRLDEWEGFCSELLQIPTLRNTPLFVKASEVVTEQSRALVAAQVAAGANGAVEGAAWAGARADEGEEALRHKRFRALHVDPPLRPDLYREPDEDAHDKILFILNNVSEHNIDDKLKDLKEVLLDEHHQWFAAYLVEERAKLQPNFQQLYLCLLELINNKMLWALVIRETYVSAIKLLNAESTLHNSTDRNHLKNLGSWLGSLTIARDKPIKHRNIYFKDLLIEAFDTQRLTVAIPFTCKVLVQARKSTVFRPPNPWLMEVLSLLTEIYHFGDLKMILKFEIEVVCQDLQIDLKSLEPSTCIRERPPTRMDDLVSAGASLPEELQGFDDLPLINAAARGVSPTIILQELPALEQLLVVPPAAAGVVDPNVLRSLLFFCLERSITDITPPVVERSITIASISASHLLSKDFAMEPDEEKYRQAAMTMVRALAGSLALVTCKEPLRTSTVNCMKLYQHEYVEQLIPEGLIEVIVGENLAASCNIIEKVAEHRAVPVMEKQIENAIEARRIHRLSNPNEPYIDANISRWAFFIPEPYRQQPGGLNEKQLAIYNVFGLQTHVAGHVSELSSDSSKVMPDIVPDNYSNVPLMQTPGQVAAVPQVPPVESLQQPAAGTPQANGFVSPSMGANPQEKLEQLVQRVQDSARSAGVEHIKDLPKDTPILQDYHSVIKALYALPNADHFARFTAQVICIALHELAETNIEVEILVHLLSRICELAPVITKDTRTHLAFQNEGHLFNVPTLMALNEVGLLEFALVDPVIARMLRARNIEALMTLSDLLDRVLLNDEPTALRSDFAASLEALSEWLAEDYNLTRAADIMNKLRRVGIPQAAAPLLNDQARSQRDQMEYIFSEWLGLYKSIVPGEAKYLVFLDDLHKRGVMKDQEGSVLFLRVAVDLSVAMFDHVSQTPRANLDEAFLAVDALAKLVVLLVKYQGDVTQDDERKTKPDYLRSILSLLILVMNHHQIMRGVTFNQRVFFRLFSSILCEYYQVQLQQTADHQQMMLVFAQQFTTMQPKFMPAFTFGWVSLISHRTFLAGILNMPDRAGWPIYCEIIQALLAYIGDQLKSVLSWPTKELYNGVLRILLILHHDFPEFILENHFSFCNVIPAHCSQLRNLILSAYPSSFPKLPDPFREGLKMDSLEETHQTPRVAGDIVGPLERANIKDIVDKCLQSGPNDKAIQQICQAVYKPSIQETALSQVPISVDVLLLSALVLYIGNDAVSPDNRKAGFANSHATALLDRMSKAFDPEGRYYFLSGVANQLRYPNSHTHYFSFFILHHFGSEPAEDQGLDIREQIVRVLLERLIVHRPHPWGLIITLQELLRNRNYAFFDLPFIQRTPEIGRLFDALLAHIQLQSPRVA